MYITDFLKFESSFEGNGIVHAAAKIEKVFIVFILLREGFYLVVLFEYAADLVRNLLEFG